MASLSAWAKVLSARSPKTPTNQKSMKYRYEMATTMTGVHERNQYVNMPVTANGRAMTSKKSIVPIIHETIAEPRIVAPTMHRGTGLLQCQYRRPLGRAGGESRGALSSSFIGAFASEWVFRRLELCATFGATGIYKKRTFGSCLCPSETRPAAAAG